MNRLHTPLRHPLALLLTLLLSLGSLCAQADLAGQIIMAKGQVIARSADGQERPLQRRSDVFSSDTLLTGPDSRLQIRFIDQALLTLQENSQLHIREYHLARGGHSDGRVLMELVEGGFRTLTGTIGKGNKEAYTVTTPVASIGIRGTLYSAQLQGNQLLAGVWQGGIRLLPPNGAGVDLGADRAFSFGRIGPAGFSGSLQPPAGLEPATGNSPAAAAPLVTAGGSAPGTPDSPIPVLPDQFGSDQLLQGLGIDLRFSATEKTRYDASGQVVFLISGDRLEQGRTLMGDDGRLVLVSEDQGQPQTVYRYAGEPTLPGNSQLTPEIGDSRWGVWGQISTPDQVTAQRDPASATGAPLETPLYWVAATPLQLSDLSIGSYNVFTTGLDTGTDSWGNELSSAYSSFTLNLDDQSITDGYFSSSYSGPDSSSNWNFAFTGRVTTDDQNRIWLNMLIDGDNQQTRPSVTGVNSQTQMDFSGTINVDNSQFSGFLLGDNTGAAAGAVTQHQLEATLEGSNEVISANGISIWTAQPLVQEPPVPGG